MATHEFGGTLETIALRLSQPPINLYLHADMQFLMDIIKEKDAELATLRELNEVLRTYREEALAWRDQRKSNRK